MENYSTMTYSLTVRLMIVKLMSITEIFVTSFVNDFMKCLKSTIMYNVQKCDFMKKNYSDRVLHCFLYVVT